MSGRDQLIELAVVVEAPPFRRNQRSRQIAMLRLEAIRLIYSRPHIVWSNFATSGYKCCNPKRQKSHVNRARKAVWFQARRADRM
jgi:hypothetical protein